MSDYRITVTLKQQTPMLHFQADTPGATLRPSEVKPKLDRFLQKKYHGTMPKEWFLKQTNEKEDKSKKKLPALKYQMRIRAKDYMRLDDVPTIYYGNNGDSKNKAYCIQGDCKLTIICFNKELKEFIDANLAEFFVTHNFGRMQDKGFGSYIVEGRKINISEALIEKYGAEACYYISGYTTDIAHPERRVRSVFNGIKNIYQSMKSGYNINDIYHRSFLFEYFHEIGIGNEKAYIKRNGLTPRGNDGKPYHTKDLEKITQESDRGYKDEDCRYVRALLGLSEQFEYKTGRYNNRNREIKEQIKIEDNGKNIERFASPIFFKVVDDTIYIVAGRIDERIYKKNFSFRNGNTTTALDTPSEFNIDAFMEYFFENFNKWLDERIRQYGRDVSIKDALKIKSKMKRFPEKTKEGVRK